MRFHVAAAVLNAARAKIKALHNGQLAQAFAEIFIHRLVGDGQGFFQGQQVVCPAFGNQVGIGALAAGRVVTDQDLAQIHG